MLRFRDVSKLFHNLIIGIADGAHELSEISLLDIVYEQKLTQHLVVFSAKGLEKKINDNNHYFYERC